MRTTLDIGLSPTQVDSALLAAKPAAHGLTILPFLTGERSTGWDPRAKGAISGLNLDASALDILQAGLDAVAYRFAAIMLALRPAAPALREVICTGGALLGSPAWVQVLADVLELPLACADEPEASSRGAAILALEALGFLSRTDAPSPAMTRRFLPRAEAAEAHRAAFRAQEQLRRAVLRSIEP
jgi:gluconokinase